MPSRIDIEALCQRSSGYSRTEKPDTGYFHLAYGRPTTSHQFPFGKINRIIIAHISIH